LFKTGQISKQTYPIDGGSRSKTVNMTHRQQTIHELHTTMTIIEYPAHIFTTLCYTSTVYSVIMSVLLSFCLSVTSYSSEKTAKPRIT